MIEVDVKVDTSGYKKVLKDLPLAVEKALYAIGVLSVEGAVRSISGQYTDSNLAVDTGRLRASLSFITPEQSGDGGLIATTSETGDKLTGQSEKDTVIVGTNVGYAEYVHNGTSRMQARPFLREGIDEQKQNIKEAVEDVFKNGA